ncbi:hypothetical protein [Arthrobacter sp. P2b]|uniref:hypothetical protein n=1 Tax=Arthrobacter sp. P2b TaxID=1938741 RepID=UPI0009A702D0|nr:hypothetical protein [Arthrobacter sp. P2b]
MTLHLQPDWHGAIGQFVEIRQHGKVLRTGVVEAVMADESILWISADGIYPREMVERADGKEVFTRFAWNQPPGEKDETMRKPIMVALRKGG